MKAEYYQYDNAGVLQLVGYITRETALAITVCSDNNAPQLQSSGSKNKFSVCEGNKLCFSFTSSDVQFLPDQTVADTTELSWNNTIADATFTITDPSVRERAAQFCWQTKLGDARNSAYTFTVEAHDRHCPSPSVIAKGFNISVVKRAVSKRYFNILSGNRVVFGLAPDTANGDYTVTWEFRDSINTGLPVYRSFKRADTVVIPKQGKYIVTTVVANDLGCLTQYTDTLYIGTTLKIRDLSAQGSTISVYPNPARGEFYINFAETAGDAEIEVTDITARRLYHSIFSGDKLSIDTHEWPAGIVMLRVKQGDLIGYYKLLVE